MRHTNQFIHAALLASVAVLLLAAFNPASAAVEPRVSGSIPYVTGGIGADERDEFKAMAKDYNARLGFADAKSGVYLAGVSVAITDNAGKMLVEDANAGPWLYVNLPRGAYRVKATFQNVTREAKLNAGKPGGPPLMLFWNALTDEPEDAGEPRETPRSMP